MQQRLSIARTLAVEPEVLLMDEPASALDPIATQKIEESIRELKASLTIIIVTHNMQQAARVPDCTGFFTWAALLSTTPRTLFSPGPARSRLRTILLAASARAAALFLGRKRTPFSRNSSWSGDE